MRFWLALFFFVVLGTQAALSLGREELGAWMQAYHAAPKPEDVAGAIGSMHDNRLLAQPGTAAPAIGFLSAVFARHPDRVVFWLGDDLSRFSEPEQRSLLQAVWLSGTSQSRAILAGVGPEKMLAMFKRDLSQVAPSAPDRMTVRSPGDLDFLWGRFFGSGSAEPVQTIISALRLKNVKRETSPGKFDALPPLTGAAAQWSLTSNASRYDRVLEICRAELLTATGETADLLREVLAKAEERRKPRA
jgi:hypothetical protein